ncbi:MAG TPA: glycosyltransferase [Gammaproteobacteria bacterium]
MGARRSAQEITAVVVNCNGGDAVLRTIASLLGQRGVRMRIVVVDDGSTDGSAEAIERRHPGALVHREPRNTQQVNRLRNIGIACADTDKVLVTDNDIVFDPNCAAEMLRAMGTDPAVAACIPRMMYADDPAVIYMAGGRIHYVGATIAPHRHERYDGRTEPEEAIGGGIALYDRRKLAAVGGFDEGYALAWGDDAELHQRLLLAGFKTLLVPTAACLHHYKRFDRSRHYRARGQVSNRWRYLLSHYEARTLLLTAPALLLYELLQAGFLTAKRLPHLYLLGTLDALRALPRTLRRRREVQALRRVPDRELLFAGDLYVRPEHGTRLPLLRAGVAAASGAFALYWRLVRPGLARSVRRPAARLVDRKA